MSFCVTAPRLKRDNDPTTETVISAAYYLPRAKLIRAEFEYRPRQPCFTFEVWDGPLDADFPTGYRYAKFAFWLYAFLGQILMSPSMQTAVLVHSTLYIIRTCVRFCCNLIKNHRQCRKSCAHCHIHLCCLFRHEGSGRAGYPSRPGSGMRSNFTTVPTYYSKTCPLSSEPYPIHQYEVGCMSTPRMREFAAKRRT